jgi:hypothetical protein
MVPIPYRAVWLLGAGLRVKRRGASALNTAQTGTPLRAFLGHEPPNNAVESPVCKCLDP